MLYICTGRDELISLVKAYQGRTYDQEINSVGELGGKYTLFPATTSSFVVWWCGGCVGGDVLDGMGVN